MSFFASKESRCCDTPGGSAATNSTSSSVMSVTVRGEKIESGSGSTRWRSMTCLATTLTKYLSSSCHIRQWEPQCTRAAAVAL
jgi:hypothetical protein